MKAVVAGLFLLAGLAGCTEGRQREEPAGRAEESAPAHGYVLVGFLGSSGDSPGKFRSPTGIAIGEGGELYIADSGNHRIQVLSPDGAFLRKWGEAGDGPGQFEKPIDVAIGPDGSIYVADFGLDRVQKFTARGEPLLAWGRAGSAEGEFAGPAGLATDPEGRVYVVEFYNHRIQVFDASGHYERTLGTEGHGMGELYHPTDLTLRSDGSLLVADAYNYRIQALTPEGKAIDGQYDMGKSLERSIALHVPTGVALDASRRIHVADSANKRAVLLGDAGSFVSEWKLTDDSNPKVYSPTRVAASGDRIYFVDTSNDRILVLEVR